MTLIGVASNRRAYSGSDGVPNLHHLATYYPFVYLLLFPFAACSHFTAFAIGLLDVMVILHFARGMVHNNLGGHFHEISYMRSAYVHLHSFVNARLMFLTLGHRGGIRCIIALTIYTFFASLPVSGLLMRFDPDYLHVISLGLAVTAPFPYPPPDVGLFIVSPTAILRPFFKARRMIFVISI